MPLPLRTLPILERWDCHTCGACCKGHTVLLDGDDQARLRDQDWQRRPEYAGVKVIQRLNLFSGRKVLAQRPNGSCIFLTDDNRCRVHAEFGEAAKPWACRMFPYQVMPVDDHVRVTMRRTCPSAAANKGRPLAEQLAVVRELAPKALPDSPLPPPAIGFGDRRPWPEVRRLTDLLERRLLDDQAPLVRRLVHASRLIGMLAESRSRRLKDADWKGLLEILDQTAARQTSELFRERREPGGAAKLVFRQTAAEYVRFHPNLGDRPTWSDRWRLFRSAVAIARGVGRLPRIHPDLPVASFADLERPLGHLSEEVAAPLTRYFASMAASLQYCGAGYHGWPVIDGFRALTLAYPVAMWTLRWLADGREPTAADSVQTVVLLDRSHYYPLLAGYRHRHRLRILAQLDELERLAVWYAR